MTINITCRWYVAGHEANWFVVCNDVKDVINEDVGDYDDHQDHLPMICSRPSSRLALMALRRPRTVRPSQKHITTLRGCGYSLKGKQHFHCKFTRLALRWDGFSVLLMFCWKQGLRLKRVVEPAEHIHHQHPRHHDNYDANNHHHNHDQHHNHREFSSSADARTCGHLHKRLHPTLPIVACILSKILLPAHCSYGIIDNSCLHIIDIVALIFIGPESDHCLPLSLTHSLTD